MNETWYVIEDGSVAHPRDVARDAKGILRRKDGQAVAYRPDGVTPRSRSVDVDAVRAKAAASAKAKADADKAAAEAERARAAKPKDMKPEEPKPGYKTRETKADQ